jgi:hypothetical protein
MPESVNSLEKNLNSIYPYFYKPCVFLNYQSDGFLSIHIEIWTHSHQDSPL